MAKWLLGGAAAVLLLGAGYFAWKTMAPTQENQTETAYNDPYAAEPLAPSQEATAADVAADASPAASEPPAPRPARRARAVPEETIGVTPASATTSHDSDEIVVTARRPTWTQTPSARRLAALYPERARARGREGEARLHCTVQDGGALDCEQVSETSRDFGQAALRVARTLRHSPQLADGRDAAGTPVNLRVVFRMEDERRRG
jgi:TonB family protein